MNRYFKLAPTHFKLLTIVFLALLGISAQAQSPQLLKDIYPGTESSYPFHLIELGNKAVFVATDNAHGLEMWVTDGTPGNTTILKDIASGVTWGQPRSLAKMNGKCYFVVDSSTSPVSVSYTHLRAHETR